jgi:hypothetical protein
MVSNRVRDAETALASKYSRGVVIAYNAVTGSRGGIHTYYAGQNGAGTRDQLLGNRVDDGLPGGTAILTVAAVVAPEVTGNTINRCSVGLAVFGDLSREAPPRFIRNVVDGHDSPESVGVFITTDGRASGANDVHALFTANRIKRNVVGFRVVEQRGRTNGIELRCNVVRENRVGLEIDTTHPMLEQNTLVGNGVAIDGASIATGTLVARHNYWGCGNGRGAQGCNRNLGPIDDSNALAAEGDCTK